MIVIKFYGYLARRVSKKEVKVQMDSPTVEVVLDFIWENYPQLEEDYSSHEILIVADGRTLVMPRDEDAIVKNELALVPVMEGGSCERHERETNQNEDNPKT